MQFLELSIPAVDLQESLEFYQTLGFSELPTTDARSQLYGVVSNGALCIGLHGNGLDGPGLTFIRRNLAQFVREQSAAGELFDYTSLGMDSFHEARLRDPDGTLAILLEARTFSPGIVEADSPVLGDLLGIALPCMNTRESQDFWQNYGFIGVDNAAGGGIELHTPGLTLLLGAGSRQLTLHFQPCSFAACLAKLANLYRVRLLDTLYGPGAELTAPEGTRIQIINND